MEAEKPLLLNHQRYVPRIHREISKRSQEETQAIDSKLIQIIPTQGSHTKRAQVTVPKRKVLIIRTNRQEGRTWRTNHKITTYENAHNVQYGRQTLDSSTCQQTGKNNLPHHRTKIDG